MSSALERLRKARQGSGTSLASANIGGGMAGSGASGGSALAKLRAARSSQTKLGGSVVQKPALTTEAQRYASEEEKNRGGPLGGIGYVAEKVGLGVVQTFEGAVDYVASAITSIFDNEAAKDILENDWVDYGHADEWFNPSEGWKIAGDVGSGIGTSLAGVGVGLAVSAIPGGAALAPAVSLGVMGLGAAGTSTKEAYQESGELGLKEFGYGAIMGGVELAAEKISGGLGAGVVQAVKSFTKSAAKTATAITLKSVGKQLGKEFVSEALEEGFSTLVSPIAKRITYDPDAEFATPEEIAYSAFVGGLSGMFMGGGTIAITEAGHRISGGAEVKAGNTASIMATAKAFSDYEGEHPTGLSSMAAVHDLYTRLEKQGVQDSTSLTGEQKRAVGELRDLTTYAVFEAPMQKSALTAISGAEAIAEKLNTDGNIKMVDGKPTVVTADDIKALTEEGKEVRDITAEDIRAGVDEKNSKSIAKAMKQNDLLRYIVASDVAGRFMMTADEVETAARAGTKIKSQADLNAFIENATPEQKAALGRELGIAENEWATMSLKRFNQAAAAYRESGKLDAKRTELQAQKEKAPAVTQTPSDVAKTLKTAENAEPTNTAQGNVSVSGEKPLNNSEKSENSLSPSARMTMDTVDTSSTAEELQKVIDTKRTEVVNEIVDKSARRAAMEVDIDAIPGVRMLTEKDLPTYLRAGGRANKYKNEAIAEGKKIILTSSQEVREYIEKAIAGDKDLPVVAYGKVSDRLADDVEAYSKGKINIRDYYLELVAYDIRHSHQEHLYAKESGDIDLKTEDFVNIPGYVADYDDFVYVIKYKSGTTKICVSKKNDDGRVVLIETVSKSHGSIEFKNMIGVSEQKYIEKYAPQNKNGNSTNTGGSASSNTSPRDETVSKVSISHPSDSVNRESEKNSRRASMDITPELEAEFVSPTEGNVGKSRFEKADIKLGDKIKDTFTTTADKLYIDTVDELYGVEKYLKTRGKMKDANAFTQSVRAAETMAQTMIGVAQYDITDPSGKKLGDGLTKIFKKYKLRKIDGKFNDYLLHQLNVDRMTLEERSLAKQEELRKAFETAEAAYHRAKRLVDDGKRKTVPKDIWNAYRKAKSEYENYEVLKNKPVFGENETRAKDITAEESRKIIAEFEKRYPEFKESAEAVWAYSRNLQAMRVAAGLLSQESADIMAEYYPHYVPSFRDKNGGVGAGTVKNDSQLAINSTVKSAKGGGEDVYDVEESMAIQTRQTIKAIKMNQLANAVYDAAVSSGDTKYVLTAETAERIENAGDDAHIDIDIELTPKNNQIVFYRDGKKVAMNVSEEIFKGFKGVTEGSVPDFALARLSSKVLGGFKNLVTQYSPAFAARNFIRDMQDAMINTKHPKGFATHIKDALMGMANNNERWQIYLAYGGFASTVFDAKGFQNAVGSRGFEELKKLSGISAKDFKSMSIPLQNIIKVIGNANSFIEQLTRFTEFNASLDAGDSIEVAINNSAEVTTNFSRHGTMVKKLNATVIPFLNASVQGFDKMLRVISGPFKEKSLTALAILLAKIVAIGITPQILNMIMNGEDEDYNDLTDEVKSNYFLIKVGDQFIKIPRGRLAGAFGGFANQIRNVSRGEGFDAKGYTESIVSNLTPVDSFSRSIFSPFRDVASNTTWYGGEIEGRQFDGVRPSQRYDESTSSIAIALGKAFNYSPKKIHYLLDQYSGVIGDFLLPATTKKAEKDYFSGNFLLDPKTNNKLSDQFYKLYDEAQYAKNEGNVTAYYQLKHLNEVKSSVSELYDEITRIQNSDLSNSEKLQQVRTVRTLINNLYKTAKADYGAYTQAIEATEGMFDESDASQQRLRYTVITQMMYGSEKALEVYNSAVYDKAVLFNKAGLDYDTYYEYYFTTRGIESDVDGRGEVVAGSKKKKTLAAIKALGVSQNERLLLTAAAGYALSDGEKRRLLSHIMRLGVSKEEKAAIAEACGFKVKNGRISMK